MSSEVTQLEPLLLISDDEQIGELAKNLNCMFAKADEIGSELDERIKPNKYIVWIEQQDTGEHDALLYCGLDGGEKPTAKDRYVNALQDALKLDAKIEEEDEPNKLTQYYRDTKIKSKHAIKLGIKDFDIDILTSAFRDAFGIQEYHEDQQLVSEAYQQVYDIMTNYYNKAVEEVGEYLIDKFYNGNLERAQKNKPVKYKSFKAFIERFSDQSYSQSWFYNAVNIALDKKALEQQGYNQLDKLSISHRKALTKVKNVDDKIKLADEAINQKLSVRNLEERVQSSNQGSPKREGFSLKKLPNKTKLEKKKPEELQKLRDEIQKRVASLEEKLEKIKEDRRSYSDNLKKIDKIIQEKNSSPTT